MVLSRVSCGPSMTDRDVPCFARLVCLFRHHKAFLQGSELPAEGFHGLEFETYCAPARTTAVCRLS